MTTLRKCLWMLCLPCLLSSGPITLSTNDGSLVGTGGWSSSNGGMRIVSDYELLTETVRYSYKITNAHVGDLLKGINRFVLQSRSEHAIEDIIDLESIRLKGGSLASSQLGSYQRGWYYPKMPKKIDGLKFEFSGEPKALYLEFEAYVLPALGDSYLKGEYWKSGSWYFGSSTTAWNSGLDKGAAKIWTLGSDKVVHSPEPATYLLLGSVLILVARIRQRQILSKTS